MADEAQKTKKNDDKAANKAWSRTDDGAHVTDFEKAPSPMGKRVGAFILWIVGIAVELFAVGLASGGITFANIEIQPAIAIIVGLVIALICSLVGASLWKKAGEIRAQAKGSQRTGASPISVFMSTASFVPMVLYFAIAKNADARTRLISIVALFVVVIAAVALVVVL